MCSVSHEQQGHVLRSNTSKQPGTPEAGGDPYFTIFKRIKNATSQNNDTKLKLF